MNILIFGDSRSRYFNPTEQVVKLSKYDLNDVCLNTEVFQGGTINGFGKRESTLGLREKIQSAIKNKKPDFVCLAFGQVDVELGLYYRKYIKGDELDIDEWISDTIKTYKEFIASIESPVVIKALNLPVLIHSRRKAINYTSRIISENVENSDDKKSIKKNMNDTFPSSHFRLLVTNKFNRELREMCRGEWAYFDTNDIFVDKATGFAHSMFIPSGFDHHYVDSVYVRINMIEALLDSIMSYNEVLNK